MTGKKNSRTARELEVSLAPSFHCSCVCRNGLRKRLSLRRESRPRNENKIHLCLIVQKIRVSGGRRANFLLLQRLYWLPQTELERLVYDPSRGYLSVCSRGFEVGAFRGYLGSGCNRRGEDCSSSLPQFPAALPGGPRDTVVPGPGFTQ